jgi:hypothetical protein
MNTSTLAAFLLAALAAAFGVGPAHAGEVGAKAVLELYTSQGCSSCPPADHLAAILAKRDGVVVLTLPVDYWDYLGWKDTLAKPSFSVRQRAYARGRGDRGIYTPQVVVNGVSAVVGSDAAAIAQAVARTDQEKDVLCVKVSMQRSGDQITVAVGAADRAAVSGRVLLAAVERRRTVHVAHGENADKRLTYTNVVRRLTPLGPWTGMASRYKISRAKAMPADADGLVALVQADHDGLPGAVLGVAVAP